jgi:signal transduction histidine kinase
MINSTFTNANILIVDDQQANIDVLSGLLEMRGYTNLKSTCDSRLVADLYESFHPDLILLDLMMPYLSGYQVMEQLMSRIPHDTYLPILVLTADITLEAKQRALASGAKDFIAKPFDLIEVGLRIDNLLFARYLYQQLQLNNQVLEKKVKERTIELEKANIDLVSARDKAEASDRLKTAFIQNISHEIRTPLNGIVGICQEIAEGDCSSEEREEYKSILQTSSDRLLKTMTNYMDISLLVTGNVDVEETDILPGIILDKVVEGFQELAESKNVAFNYQISPGKAELPIKTDPYLLQKALSQLVDNAIKFTSHGSVSLGYDFKGNDVEFYVTDTGCGIEESAKATILEHFVQENLSNTRGHEGSGLGLTIAKKIIEILGGTLTFTSVKGTGSTFYLTIPTLHFTI